MQVTIRYFFAFTFLVLLTHSSLAQKYTINDFYKVDSIANEAKPKDALQLIEKINTQARADGNSAMLIKSVIYRMLFQSYLEENAFDKILIDLRKDISLAKQPEKSILQSLLAETYWKFYEQNRWRIAQRTNVQGNIGEDINTWSLPKLTEEITKTYIESLTATEFLQNTKVDFLNNVLIGDKLNRQFRPTLYDLLAHRAIDVFTNTQITLTQAEHEVLDLNDPIWLTTNENFLRTTLPKNDSASFYISALQIFKNLITFHTAANNNAALADIDLKRLKFGSQKNTAKELYYEALQLLANKTTNTEIYADVLYEQALIHKNAQLPIDTNKQNLVKALALIDKAVKAYPKSVGAQNATNLANQIKAKDLSTKIKQYIIPNKPAQIHFTYTNVDTIFIKLYKRPLEDFAFLRQQNKVEFLKFIANKKPIKEWFVVVPKTADYQQHSLVDKVDGLPLGSYTLIAKNTKKDDERSIYTAASFGVTSLNVNHRFVGDTTRRYFVTENANGNPLKGVEIKQFKNRYNNSPIAGTAIFTDQNGFAVHEQLINAFDKAIVTLGKDSLAIFLDNYRYNYRNYNDDDEEKKVILFTDRPIYRPGQIIHFKGLVIEKGKEKNKILPSEKLEVTFKDANRKKIDDLAVTSNEFGTFSGSFTIPLGKLNGTMLISTDFGNINIQVEEYKRPTFEIVFDKANQKYKLNDSVRVQGKATSFAGYSVSNAKVSYKVYRTAIYDYSLNYAQRMAIYGSQAFDRTQIAIGKTTTKADGKFEFSYLAKATNDKINYSFFIEAEITDINGETRTKTTAVNVGKKDIKLAISASQVIFLGNKPDSISFNVSNLNNEPIKAKVIAEWSLLQSPSRLMNKSPFQAENYMLSKEEFIKAFPTDDYDNELELAKWPVKNLQYSQNLTANGNGELMLNSKDLLAGYYKIKLSAISEQNDTISIDKYIVICGTEPKKIESPIQMVIPELNVITPEESAIFRVAGLSNNAKGYYEVYYKNNIIEKVWLNLSPKQTIVRIKPKANFEDGFAVQFSMIYNGTVYNYLQRVSIIDKQKQLDIKFLTFRDKLQPGEKESWKLQISNKNGEKQMAEMVATLYDASLDDFRKMDWNRNINTNFDYNFYTWQFRTNDINSGENLWYLKNYPTYYGLVARNYENLNLFGYNYYGAYNYGYHNYIRSIQAKPKKGLSPEANKKLAELEKGKLVYGIVLDNDGYAVPGASIKSGKLGTTTNYFGVYAIDVKPGDEIIVAYLGFKTSKVKVGQKRRIDIKLQADGNALNEVIITGAGESAKRKDVTGSVAIVQSQEIKIRGASSLDGKVSGLQVSAAPVVVEDNTVYNFVSMEGYDPKTGIEMVNGKPIFRKPNIIPRTNFSETAFFYPHLKTDENGQIKIEFTIPQSLTRYKMLGFAHTKDLKVAQISNELITQKQLAIAANAPRFFREGDTIIFSAKLNNIAGKALKGYVYLELKNALTGKIIQILANGNSLQKDFDIANGGNEVLKWPLIIPSGISAITYKVVAQSGKFSDGEEMTIPVLPNSMLVTESMPINVRGNTIKTFNMDKLINSGSSKTLRNQAVTFEFTSNPVWYAIQALPYLMEYPYECAEQTFSRFYANSFATGIINSSPKIKQVFEQWKNTNNGEALLSNLEKNPELKSILLEETPWVRNADNETESKKRLAILFDLNRMTGELQANFEKLEKMQYNDGSFPWFTGMDGNRYITQHIVLGIGQLKKLKLIDEKAYPKLNAMLNKAIIYLDQQLAKDYKDEITGKHFSYLPLHYLYARSYTNQINTNPDFVKAKDFYLKRITANWKTFDSYQLGQTALVLHRSGNKAEPAKIITLLKQTAQQSDEMGMYWAKNTNGWWWYQSPIETQSLLIEAFDEVALDNKAVEEMKIWLLKNKQTNDWKTTKATAAACYALLMKGYDLLAENTEPEILIGNKTINDLGFVNAPKEAGTGYQKITIPGPNVKPEMGKVEVKNNNKTIAWGALYWQYFEQLDKITPANTGVKIKKQLFIQNSTTKGNVLTPLTSTNVLTPGDLLKVRIEIYSDRDMEYVHLKDKRSAGFEPVNVISRYKYQDGLGYYESTKDASTNFFISYLRKGTYVFEYELRVTHGGNFSNGITSLQCMYAPEFTTHSEGVRVAVK